MVRRVAFVIFVGLLLCFFASGQRRGGFRRAGRGGRGFGFGRAFGAGHRGDATRGYFVGDTAFLYDDYPFAPAVPEVALPPFTIAQTPVVEETPAPKAPSLLIELRDGRYVRYGGLPLVAADASGRANGMREVPAGGENRSNLTSESLPATVIIYRDGHREDVADYAIVGTVMYAHLTAEMAGGLHNIQISALDVAATVRVNRENGVGFVLPRANEVVTRP